MRRRTGAFHADNYEDYLEKVKESDAQSGGVSQHISPFNYLAPEDRSKITYNDNEPNLDLMQMMYRSQPGRPPIQPVITTTSGIETEETDELALDPVDNTSPTIMPAEEEPLSFNPESPTLESLVVKAMVIGASEVKRHAFIHSLVPGGDSEERLAMKSPLDFVVKTDRSGEKVVKYHFWIKECSRSDEIDRFRSIYNTYYNSVSSFIFVYNVWDKETLSAVRKTIEEVKRSISKEFKAILVGVTSSETDLQREVKISEGENIVTQEGLSEFVETDLTDNSSSSTEKVARFLKSVAENQQLRLKLKKQ